MVRFYSARESGITSLSALLAAVAELADALDSKSSGEIRAGSSPASGINKFDSLVFGRGVFSCSVAATRKTGGSGRGL